MEGRLDPAVREPGIFYCNAGRGCPYDCSFCGGGRGAQRFIAGRQKIAWRPVDAMLADLLRMPRYGLDTWYNTFQPTREESWFFELFAAIRAAGLRIRMYQECLHVPSRAWIEDFAHTFEAGSRLDFVMYSGDEGLRRLNKHNYFGSDEVLAAMDIIEPLGVQTDLCFLTGLPGERLDHFAEHFRLIARVRERHRNVGVNAEILAIEPRAPMNLDPGGHGLESHATTFMDYYREHRAPVFVGFTPGAYGVEVAQALAAYTRVAHRCREPHCLFSDALLEDTRRFLEVPVAAWKNWCRSCARYGRCFASPLFADLDEARVASHERKVG
jgi:hypothetical protein